MAMDWSAVISGGSQLLAAGVNYLSNNRTNNANRDINKAQIEYAREAFEKEKEYNNFLLQNSKQMQMSDSKAAGVNPAFANGSQVGGASTSPSMNMPSQIPMDYNFDSSGIAAAGRTGMDMLLGKAQIRKMNAETDLTEAQKDRQLIENQILPELMKSQVNVNLSNVAVNGQNIELSKKNGDKISKEILYINKQMQQIDATIEQIKQSNAVLKQEERIKEAQAVLQSDYLRAQIDEIRSRYHLNETQARDIMVTQTARLFNIQADTLLKGTQSDVNKSTSTLQGAQYEYTQQQTVESKTRVSNIAADTDKKVLEKELVYWNTQQNKLDFEIDRDYKRTERKLQAAKVTAETAAAVAQAAKNTADVFKPF